MPYITFVPTILAQIEDPLAVVHCGNIYVPASGGLDARWVGCVLSAFQRPTTAETQPTFRTKTLVIPMLRHSCGLANVGLRVMGAHLAFRRWWGGHERVMLRDQPQDGLVVDRPLIDGTQVGPDAWTTPKRELRLHGWGAWSSPSSRCQTRRKGRRLMPAVRRLS